RPLSTLLFTSTTLCRSLFSCLLLRLLFIGPYSLTQQLTINMNLRRKKLVMLWPRRGCRIVWCWQLSFRTQLLQGGLPVHVVTGGDSRIYLLGKKLQNNPTRGFKTVLQIDRAK